MKAMIISAGGTPEPLVLTILEHKPDFVCFLASQQSLDLIGEVKRQLKEQKHKLEDHKVICEDVNNLVHCYEKAVECAERVREVCANPDKVVVDYTGGTKTMTAALSIATVGHGYQFSYVGGEERTKNGLGVVVSGTEVVETRTSPWQIFAVEERKKIALFISTFQYEAALSTMLQTLNVLSPGEQELWSGIVETLRGYQAWDNFDHQTALRSLSAGLKKLELCGKFCSERPIQNFIGKVKENFETLNEMNKRTKFFNKMHPILIRDLVSNARRRYLQTKYDDAVARLYRVLEMVGQIEFEKLTGCPTSDVDPEKLSESTREEYISRYQSPDDGKMKLPLNATFRALKELGHHTGERFYQNEETFKKIMSARNDSILAHGTQHIKKETYEKFAAVIEEHFIDGALIEFPGLDW